MNALHWVVAAAVLLPSPAGNAWDWRSGPRKLLWNRIPPAGLADIRSGGVDRGILEHPHERRGFVSVPLDYRRPSERRLDVFYRLMPSRGPQASDNPILVLMNGGPGVAASAYRALDYDYDRGEPDSLSELSRYFRILAVDQRGTGHSAPLDLDPSLSPEIIARYFDSDEHARDHARVNEAVVPEAQPFFVLARSYSGEIGFQYLTLEGRRRTPAGIVFDSAVLPHTDALETFLIRRRTQRELNQELRRAHPATVAKRDRLRRHLELLGIPAFIASVDREPPPSVRLATLEAIRRAIGPTQVLFTFGRSDAFLPQDLQLERARRFDVPGHTAFRVFDSGHGAAFSEEGAALVGEWASAIGARQAPGFDFVALLARVAEGWGTNDTELALSAFTEDATYMEPPDRHLFRGHAELRRFFDAVNPGSSMIWHRMWFDEDSGIGAGEYSFHNGGRQTAAHGVAVVEIRDGRIADWREYQQRGAIDFQDFLEVEGKQWKWTVDSLH